MKPNIWSLKQKVEQNLYTGAQLYLYQKLYSEVFYKVRRKKNNDLNMGLENRMRAKYEKYDKDSQVVLKFGHQ